jgi:hypothetical protein
MPKIKQAHNPYQQPLQPSTQLEGFLVSASSSLFGGGAFKTIPIQGCQIFLGTKIPKRGKIYHITIKSTQWPQYIPNGYKNSRKIDQHLP